MIQCFSTIKARMTILCGKLQSEESECNKGNFKPKTKLGDCIIGVINETQFSLNAFVVFKYLTYTSLLKIMYVSISKIVSCTQTIGNNYFSEYLQKNSGVWHLKNFMFTSHTYVKRFVYLT